KHSLKNAVIPVVTVLGLQVAQIAGGAVIIETIFGLPGMGQFLVDSIVQRDYPVIQGINILVVMIIVATNLLVDLCYAVIDPRIRYGPWPARSRPSRPRSRSPGPSGGRARSSTWRGSAGASRSAPSAP